MNSPFDYFVRGDFMKLFKAKDGTLINPLLVMTVRINKEEGKHVVKFVFGSYSREILFDRQDDAEKQAGEYSEFCADL